MRSSSPASGSSSSTYARLLGELPPLLATFDETMLLVTHHRHEALRLAQDLVILVDGRVHAAGDARGIVADPRVREVAEVLGFSILTAGTCRVAVPPGALRLGVGSPGFTMVVEDVVDLVERTEIVGSIDETRVHVVAPAGGDVPARGDRVLVHAERACPLA